ncbi:MAG: hypothetical protein PVS3B3_31970 [Ktedonobacteraceae bacterium]
MEAETTNGEQLDAKEHAMDQPGRKTEASELRRELGREVVGGVC